MKYKPFVELEELLRISYRAVDIRHSVDRDDNRLEFSAGDWANPIDIGECNNIPAKRIVQPPANEYIFSRSFEEHGMGYFIVKLGPYIVSVKRVTHEEARDLEEE